MVEPSNKKIIIAVLVLLGIFTAIALVAWVYVHRFSGTLLQSNEPPSSASSELNVPSSPITGMETFEPYIEQFEVGGKSNLLVYQFPPLEKCSINRFEGVAQTNFKNIFHSLKLQ